MEITQKQLSVEETLDSIFELLGAAEEIVGRTPEETQIWNDLGADGHRGVVLVRNLEIPDGGEKRVRVGLLNLPVVEWVGLRVSNRRVSILKILE